MTRTVVIDFGRDICNNFESASQREWLVTNGIGGYASGTVAGNLTRRYHGLLVAALKPPTVRSLLLTKIEEAVRYREQQFFLYCNHLTSGAIEPTGYNLIERFHLEGKIPVWTFAFADAQLEKRIWMQPGANTTYIQYIYTRSMGSPIQLQLRILVNDRDHHQLTHANQGLLFTINLLDQGISILSNKAGHPLFISWNQGQFTSSDGWARNIYLKTEDLRGLDAVEDHRIAGILSVDMAPGDSVCLVASTEKTFEQNGDIALNHRLDYEKRIYQQSGLLLKNKLIGAETARQLVLAADQFIVSRSTPIDSEGQTLIAGYPWFNDWGRDTMISLPGLTLATGRPETARKIIRTFAAFVNQGMLPNHFPDAGQNPEYNTFDATLWYFQAIRSYFENTRDIQLLKEVFPILEQIIHWHLTGTRFNIHCDPSDGLLFGGEAGSQLTWMDVRIDGWAITPRIGKPVEINALWFNALRSMASFCLILGKQPTKYQNAAAKIRQGYQRFWNPQKQYLFDVLDGPEGNDPSLRPNQLLAVALDDLLLTKEQAKAVVDICAYQLLTPYGLRTLAPEESGYIGHYGGSRWQRDVAYHKGTAWCWLIGPFIQAYLRVYHDPYTAMTFLLPLIKHLEDHGLGSISEIFDGDAPFTPGGCIAQAWSVAELIQSFVEIFKLIP